MNHCKKHLTGRLGRLMIVNLAFPPGSVHHRRPTGNQPAV